MTTTHEPLTTRARTSRPRRAPDARLLAALLAAGPAGLAAAVPVTLDLAPPAAGVNRAAFTGSLATPLGVAVLPGSTDLSGTVSLDVGFTGSTPTSVRFLDATDVGLTDVALSLFGVSVVETSGVRGTLTSGEIALDAAGGFDLGGATLTLDEGFVDVAGDDPANNDLAGNPLTLTLAAGDRLTLAAVDTGGGLFDVTLSGPASFEGRVDDDPVVDVAVAGNLLAAGSAVVPEPASLALLCVGGVALLPRRGGRQPLKA